MTRVLFICVHNSARSQMAEELLRKLAEDIIEVESAGIEPGALNPFVIRALREEGIDISPKKTQSVFALSKAGRQYRYVITVCSAEAAEKCPIFPGGGEKLHWPFPDPAGFTGTDEQIMEQVRKVRDSIRDRVQAFAQDVRGGELRQLIEGLKPV